MNAVAALLAAVCVSVISAIALAFPMGGLTPTVATIALGAGIACGAWQLIAGSRAAKNSPPSSIGVFDWLVIIAFALFSLRAFCWLVFQNGDQIQILSPNNLGDLALHLTYINNLANGVPFWPANPIFGGGSVHYPIGIDVFNALLTIVGVDVYRGLIWVGLVSCLLTGVAFYKWGRGFAIAGFLFNGGFAGFLFFSTYSLADFQAELAWKSIPLSMLVTQRGLLYAIPAGLILLCSWRRRFFAAEPDKIDKPLPFWLEVILYSTMPVFHLHTFIFLSLLLGWWFLTGIIRHRDIRETNVAGIFKLIAWSFLPATMLVFLVTGSFQSSSIVHFVADWMYGDQPQFEKWAGTFGLPWIFREILGHAACWLVNFGLFPFLVIALVCVLIRNRKNPASQEAIAFVVPSIAIFILSLFVMLAPWEWDNTKIMIWPYFVILPFLWNHLLAKRPPLLQAACCFVLYFSGFISVLGGIDDSHTGYEFATRSELYGVATAVKSLPATAVFAAAPTYNHPLLLIGRNVVAGYPGHLWSHGIDAKDQLGKIDTLFNGEADWQQTAQRLHARYLFWGTLEKKTYEDSTEPWKQSCLRIAQGPWGEIYDLQSQPPVAPAVPSH